jgi:transcription elongation factor Elf1
MGVLSFTCPNTQRRALTNIETNVKSLRAVWSEMLKVNCSLCGEVHEMSVRETFVDSALHEATDRLRRLI